MPDPRSAFHERRVELMRSFSCIGMRLLLGGGDASLSLCQPFVDLLAIKLVLIDCAPAFWHINQ